MQNNIDATTRAANFNYQEMLSKIDEWNRLGAIPIGIKMKPEFYYKIRENIGITPEGYVERFWSLPVTIDHELDVNWKLIYDKEDK